MFNIAHTLCAGNEKIDVNSISFHHNLSEGPSSGDCEELAAITQTIGLRSKPFSLLKYCLIRSEDFKAKGHVESREWTISMVTWLLPLSSDIKLKALCLSTINFVKGATECEARRFWSGSEPREYRYMWTNIVPLFLVALGTFTSMTLERTVRCFEM